jgi:hypothetical protein
VEPDGRARPARGRARWRRRVRPGGHRARRHGPRLRADRRPARAPGVRLGGRHAPDAALPVVRRACLLASCAVPAPGARTKEPAR